MESGRADSADRVARGPGGAVVSELSWSDLVDAATLGLTRRPLRPTELGGVAGRYSGVLDGQDPAGTVLDAAALVSAGQRAGVLVAEGVRGPAAADPDTGPELPRGGGGGGRRGLGAEAGGAG